jgi:hypothetical protein
MLQLLQQQIYVFQMTAMEISKMFCRMAAGKKWASSSQLP